MLSCLVVDFEARERSAAEPVPAGDAVLHRPDSLHQLCRVHQDRHVGLQRHVSSALLRVAMVVEPLGMEQAGWPSGLRRWFKAPVISMAWVRIPPLSSVLFFFLLQIHVYMYNRLVDNFLALCNLNFLTAQGHNVH